MSGDLPDVDLAASSAFVAASGFVVSEMAGTRVAGHVDLGPDQHTPWGVVHGGLYCSVVESAASIGASTAVLELGAKRLPGGGGDFRVYADPVGHPFCLVWDA